MFQKLINLFSNQDSNEDDLTKLGPISEGKLRTLKNYIIKNEFQTFSQFAEYYSNNSLHSQCTESWNIKSLACRCKQCQMVSNSCVCIKCFLEGPHKYHSCLIHLSSSGNCDCGDPSAWKPEGYCNRHRIRHTKPQLNHENQSNSEKSVNDIINDDNYFVPDFRARDFDNLNEGEYIELNSNLKERLMTAFKIVRKDIEIMIENNNFRDFDLCCQFFIEFTEFGDEIRNCVSESLNDTQFLKSIFLQSKTLSSNNMTEFFRLSGALCSDPTYSIPYTDAASQCIPELLTTIGESSVSPFNNRSRPPISGIEVVLHFDYQYFSIHPLKFLLSQNKLDWIGIILKFINSIGNFVIGQENFNSLLNFESVFSGAYSIFYILRAVFHNESAKLKIKKFMIELCKSLARFEGFFLQVFHDNSQIYDVFEFILNLYKLPFKLMKKNPYFIPEAVDIFIYYLLNREPRNEIKMRNYSQSVMLHQIFLKNLLLFNRKDPHRDNPNDNQQILYEDSNADSNEDNKKDFSAIDDIDWREDIKNIIFNDFYDGKDPQDTFEYYYRQNLLKKRMINQSDDNINHLINDIYFNAIDLPMTVIAAHYLSLFKQNPIQMPFICSECFKRFHSHCAFFSSILPNLTALVQVMFSFTKKDKKDKMINEFARYFGAIDPKYNDESRKMRDFSLILFVSTLILDREAINSDFKSICLKNLMTEMKYRNVEPSEISNIISPCSMSTRGFKEKYEMMNLENDWNILIPYYSGMKDLYDNVLPTIINKTQEMLLPFPEFSDPNSSDDENELNICPNLLLRRLPEVFECKSIFALIYYCIYEYSSDPVFIQYPLNLFITFAENSKVNNDEDIQSIKAHSFDELVSNIQTNNFRTFAKTIVLFKGNQGRSLLQLINELGVIGLSTLRRVGMSITNNKKSKKKIIKLKRKISNSLIKDSQHFELTTDRRSHDCCAICHKVVKSTNKQENDIQSKFDTEMLYIPVSLFNSVSNQFVDDYIHDKINSKSSIKYQPKHLIRRNMEFKYVHMKCYTDSANNSNYFLMPKIDHLPFNILQDEQNNENENDKEDFLLPKENSKNTLEISSQHHHDRFNLNINFNVNNVTINGVPLNFNNHRTNRNNINININNNDDDDDDNINPFKILRNVLSNSSSSSLSLFNNSSSNNNRNNDNNKGIHSFLLKSISGFLTRNNFYKIAIEVMSQMIMILDHRSRLTLEILDDPMISSFYSNLFRNCIYLFYLNEKDVKFSNQIHDSIDAVILECLKMKTPKMQTKMYQLMLEKEKEEFSILTQNYKETYGNISFNRFYFSKIVQNKGSLDIATDSLDEKEESKINERSYEFLRRCYLIEKFYLCDNTDINDLFIDWDLCLNFEYLYNHFYHIKLNTKELPVLPVYRGIPLPNNFLELIYPPFNISFKDLDKHISLCIFSGAIGNERYYYLESFPKFGMPFTVALTVSGPSLTSLRFILRETRESRHIESIYVDRYGYQDPDYTRGDNLLLSREKYNQLIDDFLSGNILS